MSAEFAIVLLSESTVPAGPGGGDEPVAADAAAYRRAGGGGPGFWGDWLGEPRWKGQISELLADGVIALAVAEAATDKDWARYWEVPAMCVITGALFPGQGYDLILARAFETPGCPSRRAPSPRPARPCPKARALLGEQVMRRVFEIDAARTDLELGIGATLHGLETTGLDGTTIELSGYDELADAFGCRPGVPSRRSGSPRTPPGFRLVDRRDDRRLPRRGEHAGRSAAVLHAGPPAEREACPGRGRMYQGRLSRSYGGNRLRACLKTEPGARTGSGMRSADRAA